ncbi:MAG: CDP-glucose 4,6-dehydratase [Lachnospiraceae bacterium]|nr:CDP-glucose 4,6-dehydratase [Lachnospiraceae bacterium]
MNIFEFYKDKKVFVTGHTGFKGSWLCKILTMAGAEVTGYSLEPDEPSLFKMSGVKDRITSVTGDVRDRTKLMEAFEKAQPEIVIHMAAQPIVRESYKDPAYTYETNVMGTVNILECVRNSDCVSSFLNVTTDKVYKNDGSAHGFSEDLELNGYDPYSNSKSCSELVTQTYRRSFFEDKRVAISTARAGNVIGGGDFSVDRIIPDCIRAVEAGKPIIVRNPSSIRPYQHVLEPLYGYLLIAMYQYEDIEYQGSYNIGPDEEGCLRTGELADKFCSSWGDGASWIEQGDGGPHEDTFLKLDCARMKKTFGWKPVWNIDEGIRRTVEWTKCRLNGGDVPACMYTQIRDFYKDIV